MGPYQSDEPKALLTVAPDEPKLGVPQTNVSATQSSAGNLINDLGVHCIHGNC